jgi:hypothetical protein
MALSKGVARLLCVASLVCVAPLAAQENAAKRTPEEVAIDAIDELGGFAGRDSRLPGRPVTAVLFGKAIDDEALGLLRHFPRLKSLNICEGKITDAGLVPLTALIDLEDLRISHAKLSHAGWARLCRLPRLESLSIDDAALHDADLLYLQELPRLQALHLWRVNITDAGLVHLKKLTRLETLSLRGITVTEAGLMQLQGIPRLRTLTLWGTALSERGLAQVKEALPYTLISSDVARAREAQPQEMPRDWLGPIVVAVAGLAVLLRWRRTGFAVWRARPGLCKAIVILLLGSMLGGCLLWFAPEMYPVRDGDSAEFWVSACHLDLGVKPTGFCGRSYLPRDGWFIYAVQGGHGEFLYRVKAADAEADFPRILQRLQAAPPGALWPDVEDGYRAWVRTNPDPSDAMGLLARIREARLARLHQEDINLFQHEHARDASFNERWRRIQQYSLNIIFEFLYLFFLIVFAAWPWLRNGGLVRWALHFTLLPFLFFLPFWLGYAPFTFTSAGPTGGVIYPWLVVQFRGGTWTSADTFIVRLLPRVLEPLSQTPGPMLSLSGGGAVGPFAVAIMGLALGFAIYVCAFVLQQFRRRTYVHPR